MKCTKEAKLGALSFDVENSIALFLSFRKILYRAGKNTSQKIIEVMVFNTINFHCYVI